MSSPGNQNSDDALNLEPHDSATENAGEEEGYADVVGVDLLYQMDVEDITALRKYFYPKNMGEEWLKDNPEGLSLNKTEFINAMDSIAGSCVLSLCAAKLFDALDIDDSGLLQWEEVLDAIIEKTNISRKAIEGDYSLIDPKYTITFVPHCRGESIIKIVPLETETTFCYAIVSKLGRVGVYDGDFKLLDSYRLGLKPDEEAVRDFNEFNSGEDKGQQHRRSVSTFLTDAIFISDTYALLFASSDRSLHLYDATGLVHVPLCHIIGVPNVPMCMVYHASMAGNTPGLLLLGDDQGNIIVMRFHQARNTLLKKKHPDKLDIFYWELAAQSEYVTYKLLTKVHDTAVIQIAYCAENDTILSCSRDPTRTLVIRHLLDKREPYVFKLPCGIRCFHEDRLLHVLVTGSNDNVVRIWNPVVVQRPLVPLRGHQSGVVDVRIIRFTASIFSLEANGILKVWDIKDECCIMTLPLDFPAYKIPGKKIFFGGRSIFPGPLRAHDNISVDNRSTRNSNMQQEPTAGRTSWSGSNEIQADFSANYLLSCDEEWQRDGVIVACCNYVAALHINPVLSSMVRESVDIQLPEILPPPTKEHYASAPSPWRVGEQTKVSRTPRGSIGSKSTKSTSSSSTSLPLKGKEAVAAAAPVKDIHTRRTQHRIKQQQMQMLVEQRAPHLALDLHPLQPIKFSRPLPITTRMKEKGIDVSDPERLLRSRMRRDSPAPSRLLGAGHSRNSSAKSSKSSKSVPTRKRTATSKGRLTPDWFTEAIYSSKDEVDKVNKCSPSISISYSLSK